jgi:VanZ family protein
MRLDSFTRRRWLTAYAPLVIWTIFTLGLGSGAASMGETSRFIRPLLEFLFPAADADTLYLYHAAIRKLAHLFQYGVLGLFALHAFTYFKRPVVFALSFVALIAMIDEFRQSFDPARTATPMDVLLDIVGAMLALGVVFAIRRIRRNNADRE